LTERGHSKDSLTSKGIINHNSGIVTSRTNAPSQLEKESKETKWKSNMVNFKNQAKKEDKENLRVQISPN
jgi:hypothetical protein